MTVDFVARLYHKHAPALRSARREQRRLYAVRGDARLERFALYRWWTTALGALGLPAHDRRRLKPQLDDIEAEIAYLLVRELVRPTVVEIAPDRGWSTTWLLAALRDNGAGHLYSYDIFDHSTRAVPPALAAGRWTFVPGDVTRQLDRLPPKIDYLFLDCAHNADFARWYIEELFPRLAPGTPVSVHDIFHHAESADRFGEARVLREWLVARGVAYFTAAPTVARDAFDRLMAVKGELGIAEPIHRSQKNPMVFFRAP